MQFLTITSKQNFFANIYFTKRICGLWYGSMHVHLMSKISDILTNIEFSYISSEVEKAEKRGFLKEKEKWGLSPLTRPVCSVYDNQTIILLTSFTIQYLIIAYLL